FGFPPWLLVKSTGGHHMVVMADVENLVDRYLACWAPHRSFPDPGGLFVKNDFGCEQLQVFRNGWSIYDFKQDEECQLIVLLTKSLRGQVNRDHEVLWSWCAFMARRADLFQPNPFSQD